MKFKSAFPARGLKRAYFLRRMIILVGFKSAFPARGLNKKITARKKGGFFSAKK